MQEYYNKKAKECEAVVAQLEQQIARMNSTEAESLKAQMDRVRREMRNYKAALSPVVSQVLNALGCRAFGIAF